ncbi:MAG: hypothetical protein ACRD2L_12220, partial [Terriglobia bacterium]
YVLARHNLSQVYFHKVRRIADAMLIRAVTLAAEQGNSRVRRLYAPTRIGRSYLAYFLAFDDDRLITSMRRSRGNPGTQLLGRLVERRLLKQVFREPLYRCGTAGFQEEVRSPDGLRSLEGQIANSCLIGDSVPQWMVIADFQPGTPLRKGAHEEGPEKIPIRLRRPRGNVVPSYDDVSPILRHGAHRGEDYLNIYVPVDIEDPESNRLRQTEIGDRIAEHIGLDDERPAPRTCPSCRKALPSRSSTSCAVCGQNGRSSEEGGSADAIT